MKIPVTLVIDLENPADWTQAFGVERSSDIREDVKNYVRNLVAECDIFTNGEVRAEVTRK